MTLEKVTLPPINGPYSKTAKPIELIKIEPELFFMGTSEEQVYELLAKEDWAHEWYDNDLFLIEQPYHEITLAPYFLSKNPVTNQDYFQFVWNSGYRAPRGWKGLHCPEGMEDHPVVGVNRMDVFAYIKWLNQQTRHKFRLPTEAEWEYAARGTDGRIYPWGNDFDPWRCNTIESGKHGTSPIGTYSPSGDSPLGVMDMIGNVWEWTSSAQLPYPYDPKDGRENPDSNQKIVVRGGSWYYSRKLARCACREGILSTYVSPALGFRLAHDAPPSGVGG
jgi:toxoflavin biosynthesis protein ToxD